MPEQANRESGNPANRRAGPEERWPPQAGEELPPFSRRTGFEAWNRYAGVSGDYAPMHMDDDAGRAAGYPGAIGIGDLQVAYFHNLVRGWLGRRGRLVELACRFDAPNLKDTVVTVHGTVTAVDAGRAEITLRADDDLGQTLSTGTAVVTFLEARPATARE